MHGILHPRLDPARRSGDNGVDLGVLTNDFLGEMRRAAVGHFRHPFDAVGAPATLPTGDCRTFQMSVPAGKGRICGGTIVAHVSGRAFAFWTASGSGPLAAREDHVVEQLQLVLEDLTEHDVQGCLTLTTSQCEAYDLDLVQLVAESLGRTSFPRLQLQADIHWEGTMVMSLDPPTLLLVVSIDFRVPS